MLRSRRRSRVVVWTADTTYVPVQPAGDAPSFEFLMADADARVQLEGCAGTLPLAALPGSVLGGIARREWDRLAGEAQMSADGETLLLRRTLWLVEDVIRQRERSLIRGLPYDLRAMAPCPFPLPETAPEPPAMPPLAELAPAARLPAMLWFGWVYQLEPRRRGRVRLQGKHFDVGDTPQPEPQWREDLQRRLRERLLPNVRQAHSHAETQAQAVRPVVAAFRERVAPRATTVLYQDDELTVRWLRDANSLELRIPYGRHCLEDKDSKLHEFPGGHMAMSAGAESWSRFIIAPRDCMPSVRICPDGRGPRSPFAGESGSICTAGYLACRVGDSDLSPGAMVLRALFDARRIMITGGGSAAHHPYRSLERCGGVVSKKGAQERGVPIYRWMHSARGREEVKLHV